MAPPNSQRRVKGLSIMRPYTYGSIAKKFNDTDHPRPEGTPEDHTHSWTAFVKGVDNVDISYWLKKVQFRLHESIPNHIRTIENLAPGEPWEVSATGWGQFEIQFKLFFAPDSLEKPMTVFNQLLLHPYGTEAEQEKMRRSGEVVSLVYDEMVFNEPYEKFYELMTTPVNRSNKGGKGGLGKGTRMMKDGMVGSTGERNALLPAYIRPEQPFAMETEREEVKRLKRALEAVEKQFGELHRERERVEKETAKIKAENAAAAAAAS